MEFVAKLTLPAFAVVPDFVYTPRCFLDEGGVTELAGIGFLYLGLAEAVSSMT